MRLQIGPTIGLVLITWTLAPLVSARQVVVQSQTPMRSGPNRKHASIENLAVGTQAEVIGQSAGWVQLKLADGRTGYVYQGNLRDVPETAPPEIPTAPAPDAGAAVAPSTTLPSATAQLPDDLPTLKNEITTLRAKVDTLSEALGRQQGATAGEHSGPRDGAPVSALVAALMVGFGFGALISWMLTRRSDRRSWNKLRF